MKLRDYALIGVLFVLVLGTYLAIEFWPKEVGDIALVYYKDRVVAEVNFLDDSYILNETETGYPRVENRPSDTYFSERDRKEVTNRLRFVVLGDYVNEFGNRTEVYLEVDFSINSLRIEKDETPKQIGVNRDWYNGVGLPVISLPNQVFIRFELINKEVDGSI